jgi:hypothetical protein
MINRFERDITSTGADDEQRQRSLEIANHCPVYDPAKEIKIVTAAGLTVIGLNFWRLGGYSEPPKTFQSLRTEKPDATYTALQSPSAAGARMVDFSGWEMPINYGSQIDEHHQVRRDAGMFDVSHMTVVDVQGPDTRNYLLRLLANDVSRLAAKGKALYSCMLNQQGGVIDDLITYFFADSDYRLVVNAATRHKDLEWMGAQSGDFQVSLADRPELAMIAVQGPAARA